MVILIPVLLVLIPTIITCLIINSSIKKSEKEIKDKINKLADNALKITPDEFFELKKSIKYDFEGVYILYNQTKDMYYVGQSKTIFKRVNNHFTGHGNGDVYADYKYGSEFTIKMIALDKSGFNTLNELERNTIMTYSAYSKGYNKSRGNRG